PAARAMIPSSVDAAIALARSRSGRLRDPSPPVAAAGSTKTIPPAVGRSVAKREPGEQSVPIRRQDASPANCAPSELAHVTTGGGSTGSQRVNPPHWSSTTAFQPAGHGAKLGGAGASTGAGKAAARGAAGGVGSSAPSQVGLQSRSDEAPAR